jgi:hypothetical protein
MPKDQLLWARTTALVHQVVHDVLSEDDIDVTKEFLAKDIYRELVEIRDAALEDAAQVVTSRGPFGTTSRIAADIRALKTDTGSGGALQQA